MGSTLYRLNTMMMSGQLLATTLGRVFAILYIDRIEVVPY